MFCELEHLIRGGGGINNIDSRGATHRTKQSIIQGHQNRGGAYRWHHLHRSQNGFFWFTHLTIVPERLVSLLRAPEESYQQASKVFFFVYVEVYQGFCKPLQGTHKESYSMTSSSLNLAILTLLNSVPCLDYVSTLTRVLPLCWFILSAITGVFFDDLSSSMCYCGKIHTWSPR